MFCFQVKSVWFLSLWCPRTALGLVCTNDAHIPDNLFVGARFLVFIHEASFSGTLVNEDLSLMKFRLDLLLCKLTKTGEYCG